MYELNVRSSFLQTGIVGLPAHKFCKKRVGSISAVLSIARRVLFRVRQSVGLFPARTAADNRACQRVERVSVEKEAINVRFHRVPDCRFIVQNNGF